MSDLKGFPFLTKSLNQKRVYSSLKGLVYMYLCRPGTTLESFFWTTRLL